MSDVKRIRIPWSRRWRRFRVGTLPLLTFAACLAATLWLWERQGVVLNAVGEVEAVRVDVISGIDGQLVPLPQGQWTLFDTVEANEVVAQLDAKPTLAELEVLRQDITRLQKDAEAEQTRLARDESASDQKPSGEKSGDQKSSNPTQRDAILATWTAEQRRLAVLDRQIQIEADRSALQQLDIQLDQSKRAHARNALTDEQLHLAQTERDLFANRMEKDLHALADAENQRTEAENRLAGHPPLADAAALRLLTPFRATVAAQEARMRQLKIQIEGLAIRAPITGTINAIHGWPGQLVRAGEPIVTVAATHGQYIVSYVRQDQRLNPEVGSAVSVYIRGIRSQPMTATVERLGPQFLPIPRHQRRDPSVREWGLPVRITLPGGLDVRPGELVDLVFKT
jgi:multidrug resistance efflux pump